MIEKLQMINSKLIQLNENNEINLKKYKLIEKILNDDKCFFKMNIESAYSILRDLEIPESDLKTVYMNLIDIKNSTI